MIEVLQRLGYAADSSHNKEVGKVDIFVNIDNRTFGVECIMAKRGPTDHENHRGRFDTALYAYSNADHKALVTIGSSKSRVRERVLKTKADGVEIIGLVPNTAHTGYNILYRGAQAAEGADLVEYYVECDLVARALDTSNRIRCIQKVLRINKPAAALQPSAAVSAVWVRQLKSLARALPAVHSLACPAFMLKRNFLHRRLSHLQNRRRLWSRRFNGWM
ncbi:unnamed protein product [Effrenium voratum]|uniref:Uncharacterized protein n=1 Tax=Effrenium voratum TaxID=2562239 RepID=A0AA36IUB2_9DINO|nr:unnamed protein product [Effrenium voratum]